MLIILSFDFYIHSLLVIMAYNISEIVLSISTEIPVPLVKKVPDMSQQNIHYVSNTEWTIPPL